MRYFLITTVIPPITTDALCRTKRQCSYHATVTTSPTPIQPIVNKNKLQSQSKKIAQC